LVLLYYFTYIDDARSNTNRDFWGKNRSAKIAQFDQIIRHKGQYKNYRVLLSVNLTAKEINSQCYQRFYSGLTNREKLIFF